MKAAESKRSVTVGVFIFIGIVIFILGVFTLAGKQKRFVKSITLKAIFDDVSGLTEGNNIWFSGVKVGTVKKISFRGPSQVEITMNVEEDAQQFIRKDAKAKVSSEGFIGNKNIVIYGGNPKFPAVEDGDLLHVEKALSTDEIMSTLQENNKNLLTITNDFKQLSSKIKKGEGTIGAVLTDSLMANHFRSIVTNLQEASANTAQVSGALSRFTSKLNTKGGLANQMLTDTSVFSDLKSAVVQLEQTTTSAAQVTNNLSQASSKLNASNNAVGLLLNDEETAERLKSTLQNLETSTQKLDQNMEALQHNFLLRGYFKRQAKKQAEQQKTNVVQEK
jgi:phospholipid/cholesterol/gamma-HCH transport system substrate-binding protein